MPLKSLKEVLNSSVINTSINTSIPKTPFVILKEDGITKLNKIELILPHDRALVIKLDCELSFRRGKKSTNKSNFLSPTKSDIHCGCDYVVFIEHKDKFWVNFIEMKSNCTAGAHSQLYYSIPHVEYFISIIKHHYNIKRTCSYNFLLFSTKKGTVKTLTNIGSTFIKNKVPLLNSTTGYSCHELGAPTQFYLTNVLT
jgi:hypothetical protein